LHTHPTSQPALVLGIDTGGTYTDGMLMDYHGRKVLATYKSITTKRDLSIGIEAVIEGIHLQDPAQIQMVSISTTLATNAIAEKNRKRVALLLIGYDPELIASFQMENSFATRDYHFFNGGHDLFGREQQPLDLDGIAAWVKARRHKVDAVAVSSYFSPLNPTHELRAFEAISNICDLPIVLGHQLSTRLGSVERSTTAALNASLLSVLKEFVAAVRGAMQRRGIRAPLMVVRGDGTLMSADYASFAPVETIHSGPAASAIGGRFLARLDDALVVDVGGTTTDFALIRNGAVAITEAGATVDGYKTAVKAADLFSIALGGDSAIDISRGRTVRIGPRRVLPLCCLAHQHPPIKERLRHLAGRGRQTVAPTQLEYWFLLRGTPASAMLKTEREKRLVGLLSQGPRPLSDLLKMGNAHSALQLGADELVRLEIIGRSALTPTDLLHVDGRYTAWDRDAAQWAVTAAGRLQRTAVDDFMRMVWNKITERIIQAVITFLTGKAWPPTARTAAEEADGWFFLNSLYDLNADLETRFRLRRPLIGIGAPAVFFLADVAAKLCTELILPENHAVANAVGAVAGSVVVTKEVLVYPRMSKDGVAILGYYVQAGKERRCFDPLDGALAYAVQVSRDQALAAALQAGADKPRVVSRHSDDGLDTYRVRATAMGRPRFSEGGVHSRCRLNNMSFSR